MHSTQNAVANHEYRSVPITALAESPTNPRKRFDAKSLEETGRELQDARDSGPSSGTRTGGKQVRGCGRGTSPQSGETGGTRKTSRPRSQADGCGGNQGAVRRIICSAQEHSLMKSVSAHRLHVNDVSFWFLLTSMPDLWQFRDEAHLFVFLLEPRSHDQFSNSQQATGKQQRARLLRISMFQGGTP